MPITPQKFSYNLDLTDELSDVPRSKHKMLKKRVGKLILKEIESTTRKQRSPVDGESYPRLSPKYKIKKRKAGKGTKADLHLNNKMIRSIKEHNTREGVKFEITKKKEIPKAFNHNIGDTVPQRQIMPDEELSETFSPRIMRKVEDIIAKHRLDPQKRRRALERRARIEAEITEAGDIEREG